MDYLNDNQSQNLITEQKSATTPPPPPMITVHSQQEQESNVAAPVSAAASSSDGITVVVDHQFRHHHQHPSSTSSTSTIDYSQIDNKEFMNARINEALLLLQQPIYATQQQQATSDYCLDELKQKYFQEIRRIEGDYVQYEMNKSAGSQHHPSSTQQLKQIIHRLEALIGNIDLIKCENDDNKKNELIKTLLQQQQSFDEASSYQLTDANNNQLNTTNMNEADMINQAFTDPSTAANMLRYMNAGGGSGAGVATVKTNKRKQTCRVSVQNRNNTSILAKITQVQPSSKKSKQHDQHLRLAMSLSSNEMPVFNATPQSTTTTDTTAAYQLQLQQEIQQQQQQGCVGGSRKAKSLPEKAVQIMKQWYENNSGHPYPSEEQRRQMSIEGGIHENQVKAWFANKRNRTNNTKPKNTTRKSQSFSNNNNTDNIQSLDDIQTQGTNNHQIKIEQDNPLQQQQQQESMCQFIIPPSTTAVAPTPKRTRCPKPTVVQPSQTTVTDNNSSHLDSSSSSFIENNNNLSRFQNYANSQNDIYLPIYQAQQQSDPCYYDYSTANHPQYNNFKQHPFYHSPIQSTINNVNSLCQLQNSAGNYDETFARAAAAALVYGQVYGQNRDLSGASGGVCPNANGSNSSSSGSNGDSSDLLDQWAAYHQAAVATAASPYHSHHPYHQSAAAAAAYMTTANAAAAAAYQRPQNIYNTCGILLTATPPTTTTTATATLQQQQHQQQQQQQLIGHQSFQQNSPNTATYHQQFSNIDQNSLYHTSCNASPQPQQRYNQQQYKKQASQDVYSTSDLTPSSIVCYNPANGQDLLSTAADTDSDQVDSLVQQQLQVVHDQQSNFTALAAMLMHSGGGGGGAGGDQYQYTNDQLAQCWTSAGINLRSPQTPTTQSTAYFISAAEAAAAAAAASSYQTTSCTDINCCQNYCNANLNNNSTSPLDNYSFIQQQQQSNQNKSSFNVPSSYMPKKRYMQQQQLQLQQQQQQQCQYNNNQSNNYQSIIQSNNDAENESSYLKSDSCYHNNNSSSNNDQQTATLPPPPPPPTTTKTKTSKHQTTNSNEIDYVYLSSHPRITKLVQSGHTLSKSLSDTNESIKQHKK